MKEARTEVVNIPSSLAYWCWSLILRSSGVWETRCPRLRFGLVWENGVSADALGECFDCSPDLLFGVIGGDEEADS